MVQAIKAIFHFGPLIFAAGFIWPLATQTIEAFGWVPPLDISPLWAGAIVASILGIPAQIRGRWI